MPFPNDPHPMLGETDEEFDKRLAEWQRTCLGGPMGWQLCAAAFAIVVLWWALE